MIASLSIDTLKKRINLTTIQMADRKNRLLVKLALILLWLSLSIPVKAIIWDGPTITFTKADGASATLAENQDRITDRVWLTRGDLGGLYNINQEASYQFPPDGSPSPLGTLWAFEGLNGNPSGANFSASNNEPLVFTTFTQSLGVQQVGSLIADGRRGVLHIVEDDIYIDIRFTSWLPGPDTSPGYSYQRSSAPPINNDIADESIPLPFWTYLILSLLFMSIARPKRQNQ